MQGEKEPWKIIPVNEPIVPVNVMVPPTPKLNPPSYGPISGPVCTFRQPPPPHAPVTLTKVVRGKPADDAPSCITGTLLTTATLPIPGVNVNVPPEGVGPNPKAGKAVLLANAEAVAKQIKVRRASGTLGQT